MSQARQKPARNLLQCIAMVMAGTTYLRVEDESSASIIICIRGGFSASFCNIFLHKEDPNIFFKLCVWHATPYKNEFVYSSNPRSWTASLTTDVCTLQTADGTWHIERHVTRRDNRHNMLHNTCHIKLHDEQHRTWYTILHGNLHSTCRRHLQTKTQQTAHPRQNTWRGAWHSTWHNTPPQQMTQHAATTGATVHAINHREQHKEMAQRMTQQPNQ